jgi:AraC-binding-like domain
LYYAGNAGKTAEVNWTRETEQMCLMVDLADIEQETDLLGRELPEPPVLAERSDLDGTAGRAWMQTLRLIDVAANVDAELLQYRLTVRRLEQLLIDGVSWVLDNRHRYSAELIAEPATAGQRATRRAIELLKGRPPGTPVDLNRNLPPQLPSAPRVCKPASAI